VINASHSDPEFSPGPRRVVGVSSARNYEGKREEGSMVRNAIVTDGKIVASRSSLPSSWFSVGFTPWPDVILLTLLYIASLSSH
jgi:hypothetical protein